VLVPKAWSLGHVFTVANSALTGDSATPRDQPYRTLTQLFRAYGIGPGSAIQGLRNRPWFSFTGPKG